MIVLWLFLYGGIFIVTDGYLLSACCAAYCAALTFSLYIKRQLAQYGLKKPERVPKGILLLLCLVPAANVLCGFLPERKSFFCAEGIAPALTAAFCEELFFRLWLKEKISFKHGTVAVNLLFAASHCLNAGAGTVYMCLQAMFAFNMGMCFSMMLDTTGSLLIPIAIHSLIDLSSLLNAEGDVFNAAVCTGVSCVCLSVFGAACIYNRKSGEKNETVY